MPASVSNYYIGKGICYWKPEGESTYRDLGNVTNVRLSLTSQSIDHFSSRGAVRERDFSAVTEKSGTVVWTMDEMTLENIAFSVMGEVAVDGSGRNYLEIFELSKLSGAFKFVGTNEVGRNFRIELLKVDVLPGSELGLITEEIATLEITGNVAAVEGEGWGTVTDLNSSSGGSG